MKVAIFALLFVIGYVAAEMTAEEKEKAKQMVMKALDTKGETLHACKTDADCSGKTHPEHGDMSKCCENTHICGPPNMPKLPLVGHDCKADGDCKPTFRCKDAKCHWAGPKHCEKDDDCLQGITGASYECKELAKNSPGKHCYPKCSADKDCFECEGDKCRIPQEWQSKMSCCNGNCQKKIAC